MPYIIDDLYQKYAALLPDSEEKEVMTLEQQVFTALGNPEDRVSELVAKMYAGLTDDDRELLAFLAYKGYMMDHIGGCLWAKMKSESKHAIKRKAK